MLQYCQKEIKDLLDKGLIRKSKSPWSCAAFYVNKQAELERGTPRLVINYKPLNQALQWIRALQALSLTILPGNFYKKNKGYSSKGKHFLLKRRKRKRKRIQIGSPRTIPKKGINNIISWNSSKPKTSKQTKADYAFPIETLLALQDCGLSKLPKKTWADIASESNDESKIDLKALIQRARDSKIESRIPADLKYFSSFALAWIFSWQYRYSKTENNKHFPTLQRHFFVKWWNQFDASKVEPDKVKIWFKANPKFLRPADPETSLFLNQKSQLAAFLAGSKSKEHLTKNLKEVLKMLHSQEEAESSSKTEEDNSSATTSSDVFYQNEDDCFGINLNED
ncbi:Enzymatic polyprotein, partial [Mucuna pruriens]